MGEHLPCKQGVMSSNLIISTNGRETLTAFDCSMNKRNALYFENHIMFQKDIHRKMEVK